MAELRYTESHEWCSLDGDVVMIGISKHAAEELNDLTFLDYRVAAGAQISKGDTFGEIDSVKATSELYAPADGTVEAINERFKDEGELGAITEAPEGAAAWLLKIKLSDTGQLDGLMDAAAYQEFCASQ